MPCSAIFDLKIAEPFFCYEVKDMYTQQLRVIPAAKLRCMENGHRIVPMASSIKRKYGKDEHVPAFFMYLNRL